jgi:nicotinate-nucleotide adenylyltransferase
VSADSEPRQVAGGTALLGGTFNPVHIGHLHIAEVVLAAGDYDRVLFVPTRVPAHKPADELVGSSHRLRMLEQAIAYQPHFAVSDVELRRPGTSYTIDTVRELQRCQLLPAAPGLVLGDDLVSDYHTWRSQAELAEAVRFLVARRLTTGAERAGALAAFAYPYSLLENAVLDISSTELRERVRRGQVVSHLLPAAVLEYLRHHRLYRTPT